MLRKSNCCVETVTLEKFEALASPKKKQKKVPKKSLNMQEGFHRLKTKNSK